MKKLLIAAVLLLGTATQANAQKDIVFLGFGYNFGKYNPDSLNFIIDRYNESRTYLDKKMDNINSFSGFSFGFGFAFNGVYFETDWQRKASKTSAWGVDASNTLTQRDLKFQSSTWSNSIGVGNGYVACGFSLDLMILKAKTRVGPKDDIKKEKYEAIFTDLNVGTSLFLNFNIPIADVMAIQVKPYYQFVPVRMDVSDINDAINPTTAPSDPLFIPTRLKNHGITLRLVFGDF